MKYVVKLVLLASSTTLIGMESNTNAQPEKQGLPFINEGPLRFYDFPQGYKLSETLQNKLNAAFDRMIASANQDGQTFLSIDKPKDKKEDSTRYKEYVRIITPCVLLTSEDVTDSKLCDELRTEANKLKAEMPTSSKADLRISCHPELKSVTVTFVEEPNKEQTFSVIMRKKQGEHPAHDAPPVIVTVPTDAGKVTTWAIDQFGKLLVGTNTGRICSYNLINLDSPCEVLTVHSGKVTSIRMLEKGYLTQARNGTVSETYVWTHNDTKPHAMLPSDVYSSDYVNGDSVFRSTTGITKMFKTAYGVKYSLPWSFLFGSLVNNSNNVLFMHKLRELMATKQVDGDLLTKLQSLSLKDDFNVHVSTAINLLLKDCAAKLELQKKAAAAEEAKAKEAEVKSKEVDKKSEQ